MAGLVVAIISLSVFGMLYRLNVEIEINKIKEHQINVLLRYIEISLTDLELLRDLKPKAREEFILELIEQTRNDLKILLDEVEE